MKTYNFAIKRHWFLKTEARYSRVIEFSPGIPVDFGIKIYTGEKSVFKKIDNIENFIGQFGYKHVLTEYVSNSMWEGVRIEISGDEMPDLFRIAEEIERILKAEEEKLVKELEEKGWFEQKFD